eukprot:TRINITY_DN2784_c0_g1_i5.p1 TRINITY_DN2784_c0_g1~~TRINITY_DN2784_c0_g1_i5.p1  ORF type:complete len:394 (-),score=57.25 TRINITY_DN2784_c0_g1_i5:80-1261(-)
MAVVEIDNNTNHSNKEGSSEDVVNICCGVSLSNVPRRQRIAVVIAGVFLCYLVFFMFEEMLMKHTRFGESPGFVGLATLVVSFVCASIEYWLFCQSRERKGPLQMYGLVGLLTCLETFASLSSLGLLNFPTWVVFKSSGLLTTMAGSIVILGKRFRLEDYLRAILLISGLVFFTLGDVAAHISFNPTGVLFVLASLVLNSLEVNIQEKLLHQYAVHRNEMMLYNSFFSMLIMSVILFVIGEMSQAIEYLVTDPVNGLYLAISAAISSFGLMFVLSLVKLTSAVTVAIVTSLRKAFTIAISFLLYSKPWSWKYLIGGIFLAIGTVWEIHSRMQPKPRDTLEQLEENTRTEQSPSKKNYVSKAFWTLFAMLVFAVILMNYFAEIKDKESMVSFYQ